MRRTLSVAAVIALLLTSVFASIASAEMNKFTFNDVTFPDGTTGEIEASSKDNQKTSFTTCSYYADDYETYLGYYEAENFASSDADEVLSLCLEHFEDREHS